MLLKQPNLIERFKSDFNLNGISEVYFWKSEWEEFDPGDAASASPSAKYILYRAVLMFYFIGVIISTLNCREEISIYFIYLTNLGFLVQAIYASLFFANILWVKIFPKEEPVSIYSEENPRLGIIEKIIWVLLNVSTVLPYIITIGYWGFLYTPDPNATTCQIVNNYLVHASNAVLAFLDVVIISIPIRRTHFIFPVIFGLAYTVFTILYEVADGYYGVGKEAIYTLIDWKNSPGMAAVAAAVALLCAGFGHLVFGWELFRLRVYLSQHIGYKTI